MSDKIYTEADLAKVREEVHQHYKERLYNDKNKADIRYAELYEKNRGLKKVIQELVNTL